VLSSGHFPANAGNLIADKARLPEGTAEFLIDQVRGEPLLTLQETVSYKIADAVLHCLGGWIVDEVFVRQLAPCDGIRVIIRYGILVIGPQKVESISEFRDHAIVVNNRRYAADTLSLPGGESADARPVLIVLVEEKPPRP
jgi:hypothetical protein